MASNFSPDEELSELFNRLWDMDENKCIPGEDYELDLQGYVTTTRNLDRDWANEHLFKFLDEEKVFGRDTFQAFRALLDNYESDSGKPEEVTDEEWEENRKFLDTLMETQVMQEAHKFLIEKADVPEDIYDFKCLLYNIWFKTYKRLREDDSKNSSGFEHVFVGETREKDVIGFHNWIQFYLQEKRGHIDYRGYFRRGTGDEENPRLITLQFIWKEDQGKPIGSTLIGCSPEFEFALYTVCFLMNRGARIPVTIGTYDLEIVCYRHGRGIGSAFPIAKCD